MKIYEVGFPPFTDSEKFVFIKPNQKYKFMFMVEYWEAIYNIREWPVYLTCAFTGYKMQKEILMSDANWQSQKGSARKYGKFNHQDIYGSPSKENIEKIIGDVSVVSNQVKVDIFPEGSRMDKVLFEAMEKPLGKPVIKNESIPYSMQRAFAVIKVLTNGKYYYNGKMISSSALDYYLDAARGYKGELFVIIIYDGKELKPFADDAGKLCDSNGINNYKILDIKSIFNPHANSDKGAE
jgi:hypothetical protein